MPTTPTDTTSTHTARAIYTNITPHTKHKGLNSRHRPLIHSTMPHTHHTHMHTAYAHHTQKDDAHTHTDATACTQRPCFSPTSTQYYTYHTHHTLSTNMQTPDTFPHPHPATPTLTHSYNTHITKTTATHPHTCPFSLGCSRSWRELCQLRRRDSTSRACFYKREVPHQLWPPP